MPGKEGYAAISVSPSQVPMMRAYVENQEQHNAGRSFEQELVRSSTIRVPYEREHLT